jgi:hypothetical protein
MERFYIDIFKHADIFRTDRKCDDRCPFNWKILPLSVLWFCILKHLMLQMEDSNSLRKKKIKKQKKQYFLYNIKLIHPQVLEWNDSL